MFNGQYTKEEVEKCKKLLKGIEEDRKIKECKHILKRAFFVEYERAQEIRCID